MFKVSPFYRDDIRIGRYCAHPLTAWTHLLAALAMVVLLHVRPAVDIGWGWLLFLMAPGAWLVITGMVFIIRATAKVSGLDSKNLFFAENVDRRWRSILSTRETVSFVMIVALFVSFTQWQWARPFDKGDFQHCVRTLDPGAQAVLAKTAKPGMPVVDFWAACAAARASNAPSPALPASLEELQAKSH